VTWRTLAEADGDMAADSPAVASGLAGGDEQPVAMQGGDSPAAHAEIQQEGRAGGVEAHDAGLGAAHFYQGIVQAQDGEHAGPGGDGAGKSLADIALQAEIGTAAAADGVLHRCASGCGDDKDSRGDGEPDDQGGRGRGGPAEVSGGVIPGEPRGDAAPAGRASIAGYRGGKDPEPDADHRGDQPYGGRLGEDRPQQLAAARADHAQECVLAAELRGEERIFERFTRLAGTYPGQPGGNGLGLPIARGIAQAHQGTLTCADPDGNGARFLLRLPRPRHVGPL
jgi:hypothetical protein